MSDATRLIVKFIIFVIILFATLAWLMDLGIALLVVIIVVVVSIGGIMEEASRK